MRVRTPRRPCLYHPTARLDPETRSHERIRKTRVHSPKSPSNESSRRQWRTRSSILRSRRPLTTGHEHPFSASFHARRQQRRLYRQTRIDISERKERNRGINKSPWGSVDEFVEAGVKSLSVGAFCDYATATSPASFLIKNSPGNAGLLPHPSQSGNPSESSEKHLNFWANDTAQHLQK